MTVALISELGRKQKVRVDWTHLWKELLISADGMSKRDEREERKLGKMMAPRMNPKPSMVKLAPGNIFCN